MRTENKRIIVLLLIVLCLGGTAFVAGRSSPRSRGNLERAKAESEVQTLRAENRALRRQILRLRALCRSAGLSELQINEALKSKTRPSGKKPEFATLGELRVGGVAVFPCEFQPWILDIVKGDIIASMIPRTIEIGPDPPEKARTEGKEAAYERQRKQVDHAFDNAERVVFKGLSVKGLTSRRYLELSGRFRVSGTQRISTKYGAETVFVLQVIN